MEEDKIRFFHKDIYDSGPYVGKDIRRLQELAYGMPGFDDALSDVLLTPDNFMDFIIMEEDILIMAL